MICRKCLKDFKETNIDAHHIHPRFMDNKKGNGMKAYLCKNCHMRLHLYIGNTLWKYVPEILRPKAIKEVMEMSKNTED